MNKEFFEALQLLQRENGISGDLLIEKIRQGVLKAIKKDYPDCENINIVIDPEKNKFEMKILKDVVEGEPETANEINIDEALTFDKKSRIGGVCEIKLSTAQFGRVAAQSAKQSIRHDIKEFEKEHLIAKFQDKVGECVSATVQKVEPGTGNAVLKIEKNEVYLLRNEQIPGEVLHAGDIIKVYVVGIVNPEKKPALKISRTHKDLVKRLFELEVPEIYDGTVEVKSISREAGSRSKIAVVSHDENVDPMGACVGPKGARVQNIVDELKGEKIDIIKWSKDPAEFLASALSPAKVLSVTVDEETKSAKVIVDDNQLSLAIGKEGQNVRLAAKLTNWKIDIKSKSQAEALEN